MQLESRKLLQDVLDAIRRTRSFTKGKTFENYESDDLLRSGVERQFEIIGEALRQLSDQDPDTAKGITDCRRILAFRNILIHGYAQVDDRLVWDVLTTRIGPLEAQVSVLLKPGR